MPKQWKLSLFAALFAAGSLAGEPEKKPVDDLGLELSPPAKPAAKGDLDLDLNVPAAVKKNEGAKKKPSSPAPPAKPVAKDKKEKAADPMSIMSEPAPGAKPPAKPVAKDAKAGADLDALLQTAPAPVKPANKDAKPPIDLGLELVPVSPAAELKPPEAPAKPQAVKMAPPVAAPVQPPKPPIIAPPPTVVADSVSFLHRRLNLNLGFSLAAPLDGGGGQLGLGFLLFPVGDFDVELAGTTGLSMVKDKSGQRLAYSASVLVRGDRWFAGPTYKWVGATDGQSYRTYRVFGATVGRRFALSNTLALSAEVLGGYRQTALFDAKWAIEPQIGLVYVPPF